MVAKKGPDWHALNMLKGELKDLGDRSMILKSDQEESIKSLKSAVSAESERDIITEEPPVGEHQSNGEVERAVQGIQRQARTMRSAFEERHKERLDGTEPLVPWW